MNKIPAINKHTIATGIAILFHLTGLAGILWIDKVRFAALTSLNMLVVMVLLLWTQRGKNLSFYVFFLLCYVVGFLAEVAGTHTGLIFGNYVYGESLGAKIMGVPLLIGLNWFIVIYCCGISMHLLHKKIRNKIKAEDSGSYTWWSKASIIIDGALLAVLFDWVMEPVAISLDFWQWKHEGDIPTLNYVSWFAVSVLLLFLFSLLRFNKTNAFATNLILIQFMFFLILRTLLPS